MILCVVNMKGGSIKRVRKRDECNDIGIFIIYYTDSRDYDIYVPDTDTEWAFKGLEYKIIPDYGWRFWHPAEDTCVDMVFEITEEEILEHLILEMI